MAVQVNVTIDFGEAARQLAAFQQELGAALVSESNQAEQAFQQVASQAAQNVQRQAAQITQGVQTATQGATQAARTAGKNMTEEFLRAFDPDKVRAELESAGLDEQQIEIIIETTQARAETQKLKDSIATALGEASGIAEESLTQITSQVAREVDRAAGKVKSVTEIVDGVRDLKDEIQDLGNAGGEAAEGIGMLVLNETVDKFGDLKDIFEKSAGALFGLSEASVEAAVRVADLAEKGAMVGAAFGPLGAAAGLIAGGALGFFVEKINESKAAAQEAADRLLLYRTRVAGLEVAANVALSQEELNEKIKEGAEAAKQNAGVVQILTDTQAAAQRIYDETAGKIVKMQVELEKLQKLRLDELGALEQAQAKSRMNILIYDIETQGSVRLQEAKDRLTISTRALTTAEAEQQKVAANLARAQAIQSVSTLEAAQEIEEQLLTITQGSKFAGKSTAELQKQYDELVKSIKTGGKEAESLALANIELADAQYNSAEAIGAQNENTEIANGKIAGAKFNLMKLAELEGELATRKGASAAATSASTKATTENTEATEDNAKAIQNQVRALFEAESIADKLASKTKLAEDAFVIEPKLKIPPLGKEDMLLALPSLDFASFVDVTKYIEQFEDFAVEIQDIFREQFEDKALNLSVAIDPESQKQAEKDLQDVIKNAEQVEKQRQESADYASKLANERRQKEAEEALSQAEQLLRPLEDVTMSIFDTMLENVALGKSAFADLGVAIRDSIFESLKAIGKEYAVKAIGETAQGLAALAIGGPFGAKSASEHFAAAANFAAAAVAAGVGAAAVGAGSKAAIPGGGGGGSASLGGAGGGGSPSLGAAANGASNQPTAAVVVDFRGAMFPTSDLRAAQQFGAAVAGYIDSAYKGGAISSRPRVGR